ncbi:hypothetical protein [Thiorhodococcus fuscus]|uniref:Uncharacterized protein n=1 Tax=Thiorhodococcus fuscus TaxID=527200 RepID=A0ABW4Y6H9_9GAMM
MYPKYFGLKEPSFSIAPDPQYLYLSEQQRRQMLEIDRIGQTHIDIYNEIDTLLPAIFDRAFQGGL